MSGPLRRRVEAAARAYAERSDERTIVIASGGRRWGSAVEADVMAVELGLLGVPASAIVRERSSLSTHDNARFVAAALTRRALTAAAVVTCIWHMPRAVTLFLGAGIDVTPIPAGEGPPTSVARRIWRRGREWVLTRLDGDGARVRARPREK